jgi:Ca2+-binding RTX toxin-like protein/NADPH-dependent 7-cyano-7-deazaguanine reductase QueF-like protein
MAMFITSRDITVSEADGYADFVVKLNAPSTLQVSVNYRIDGMTAGYSDYTYSSGTLSFAPGVTTQTVRVPLNNDINVETPESLALNLSSPVNAVLGDNQAIAIIIDNDTAASTINKSNLSVLDVVVDEKAGVATFDLVLDKATSSSFTVAYATANGSAAAGTDYTAASGTVSFAAGQTVKHVTVNLTDDATVEPDEVFHLNLGAITGNAAGTVQIGDGTGTALIGRNDQAAVAKPSISASDILVGEADSYVEFVVKLNAPGTAQVSVNYRVDGLTTGYSDYEFSGGTLSFAPGVTTQTVRIPLSSDTTAETLESFALNLSSPVNAVLADNQAMATIVDNDTFADTGSKASVSVRDVVVDEKAGLATFDIVLDKAVTSNFTVAYSTADGSAAAGTDYSAESGTVSFAAGQTVQHVIVSIADDTAAEQDELFHLNLGAITGSGATMAQIGDGTGTALIGHNDQTALATPSISVSDITVGEGNGYAEFLVELNAPGMTEVTVNYRIDGLTAGYSDYEFSGGTLSFAPGVTTQTVRIALPEDTGAETLKSFALNLSSPTNAVLADNQAMATIVDNDTFADTGTKASVSVRDVVVDEKAGLATFDIVLDKAVSNNFTVAYATANGSATAGTDYTAASGTVTFVAGQTVQHVTVNIADDATLESDEVFQLNLGAITGSGAVMVQIGDGSGTALIGHNDQTAIARPSITTSNITVSEADGYAEFVVALSAPGTAQVSVNYRVDNLSTGYSDYVFSGGTLSFAPGVTTQTVRIALYNDTGVETPKNFALNLSSPVNAVLADNQAVATIIDNDTFADTGSKASVSVHDVVVDEKAGIATFDIVLDKAVSNNFTVAYSTADGSATAGTDYTAASGTVSFVAGQTVQHVTVNIADDTAAEQDELFHLKLGAITGSGATMAQIGDGTGTALIGHNDQAAVAAPSISVSDITVGEGDDYVEFVVELNAPGTAQVSVNYRLDGLTVGYSDYEFTGGTLSFAPGVTTQTVRVALVNDISAEMPESFALNLSSPVNAVLADNQAVATIVDNDTFADTVNKASVSVRDVVVDEKAGLATFDIVLDNAVSNNFTVAYATANGSATAGTDYTAASGTVSFVAGQTVQHVTVNIADDATLESDEVFHLNLGALSGSGAGMVRIGDGSGTALIGHNDQVASAKPSISVADIKVSEGDSYADFVVVLDAPGTAQVSVNYRVDGLTTGYSDYAFSGGTLSFAPGVTTQTVRIALVNDGGTETLESFALNLSAPVNALLADSQAIATIVDDDPAQGSVLHYGMGNDSYQIGNTADVILEAAGGGTDVAVSTVSYVLPDNVENLRLDSSAAINGTGNALNNIIYSGAGANVINGGAGTDTVSYAYATTTGTTGVTLDLSLANASGASVASGISGADRISNIENVTGSRYNDKLTGNSGANVLDGGAGADTLSGGLGNDTYYVDNAGDVIVESSDATLGGVDVVIATVSRTLGSYQEKLYLNGSAAIDGTGNELANTITGNAGNNVLNGGGGADTLSGGAGDDVLVGGAGKDTLKGDAGKDVFDFNALSEMGTTSATWDVIGDFTAGQDRIDLSTLDANTATTANEAFTEIIAATAAFTKAGQLKFANGVLYGNVDADADAELAIQLTGVTTLSAADLVL